MKKVLKSMFLLVMPVVTFFMLAIFLANGLISGYALAVSGKGGMFYVRNNSILNLKDGITISGNSAESGGGIYVEEGGTLVFYSSIHVEFGSYPKTIKDSNVTIDENDVDSNGYFLGSDGERYAKVSATPKDETLKFSDETTIVEGQNYYFKVEPIKWRVLKTEDGKALLLCEDIIDAVAYSSYSRQNRTVNGETIRFTNYKYSEIRAWLNGYAPEDGDTGVNDWSSGGFLQTAFTTSELEAILTTEVDNSASTTSNSSTTVACENTNDKVFLLSYQELINTSYGFDSSESTEDDVRMRSVSDFARANGLSYETSAKVYGKGYWLTRSPKTALRVSAVDEFGTVSTLIPTAKRGVVPAITVDFDLLKEVGNVKGEGLRVEGNSSTSGYGNNIYNAGTFTMNGGIVGIESPTRADKNGNYDPNGDYVLFGSYPKTIKKRYVTIDESDVDSNGYFLGSDGERYAKVSATPYEADYTFSNKATIVEGTEYYFKVEPILWRILEDKDGKVLLLCEDIIDAHVFNQSTADQKVNDSTIYSNNYKYSDIRAWLNGYGNDETGKTWGESWPNSGFLQKAFTAQQQENILNTTLSTASGDVSDKVFIFTCDDAINPDYGFNTIEESDSAKQKKVTDYSLANWAYANKLGYGIWRLRSNDNIFYGFEVVNEGIQTDSVLEDGYCGGLRPYNYLTYYAEVGVAPVITISSSTLPQKGYGIYNTGTMTINGGTILDNIYSSNSFDISVNAKIEGIISLGEGAIVNVFDFAGVTPELKIFIENYDGGEVSVLKFNNSSVAPDCSKFKILNSETLGFELQENSEGGWNVVVKELDVELPTTWQTEIASTDFMSTALDSTTLTGIIFDFTVPSDDYVKIGTLSTGLEVYQYKSFNNKITIAFICEGSIYAPVNSELLFGSLTSCESITFNNFNTSRTTQFGSMFKNSSSLTSLDLHCFDTSNVLYTSGMFYKCSSLTSLNISSFDMSKVLRAASMFESCSSLTSLDLTFMNEGASSTKNLKLSSYMFKNCSGLTELNISNFRTDSVNDMQQMFLGCSSLSSLDLTSFDTSNVTNMAYMFGRCNALSQIFGLTAFNTSKVTNMEYMFYNCKVFTSLDLSNFDTANVTNMAYMFGNCSALSQITGLSSFNTLKVTNMGNMFNGCVGFETLDLSSFDMTNVTESTDMLNFGSDSVLTFLQTPFNNSSALTITPGVWYDYESTYYKNKTISAGTEKSRIFVKSDSLEDAIFSSSWKTNIQSSTYMTDPLSADDLTNITKISFTDSVLTNYKVIGEIPAGTSTKLPITCTRKLLVLQNISTPTEISFWRQAVVDIVAAKDSSYLFSGLPNLSIISCSSFVTNNIENLTAMFKGCSSLINVGTIKFSNIEKATNTRSMFEGCSSLTYFNMGSFDTSKVTSMAYMFKNCSSVTNLDLSNFDTSRVTTMEQMFFYCTGLQSLNLTGFDTVKVTSMSKMFMGCSSLETLDLSYLSMWNVTDATDMLNFTDSNTVLRELKSPINNKMDILISAKNISKTIKEGRTSSETYQFSNTTSSFLSSQALVDNNSTLVKTCSFENVSVSNEEDLETEIQDVVLFEDKRKHLEKEVKETESDDS